MDKGQSDALSKAIIDLYNDIEDDIMLNIAKRLSKHDSLLVDGKFDAWQVQMLKQLPYLSDENMRIIMSKSGKIRKEVEKALVDAGFIGADEVDSSFSALGVEMVNQSQSTRNIIKDVVDTFASATLNSLGVISSTMLEQADLGYRQTMTRMATRVASGTTDIHSARRGILSQWADAGIPALIDKAGKRWSPEAYVGLVTRTALSNTAHSVVDKQIESFGVDLVRISEHMGARPKCAPYQGKIFSISGQHPHYPPLYETSIGQPDGLFGINCGHHKTPYIEGVSPWREPEIGDSPENAKAYEESQKQRAIERKIRATKRKRDIMKETGDTQGVKLLDEELKGQQKQMREFIKSTGRTRRREREYVAPRGADANPEIASTVVAPPRPNLPAPNIPTGSAGFSNVNNRALARITKGEEGIRHNPYETGIIYDTDGNIVWKQKGGEHTVDVTEPANKGLMEGNILTHNHPKSTSFSVPDVVTAMATGVAELRARGNNGTIYRMAKTDDTMDWKFFRSHQADFHEQINRKYKSFMTEEINTLRQVAKNGKLHPHFITQDANGVGIVDQLAFNIYASNRVMERLLDQLHIKYERVLPDDVFVPDSYEK